MPCLRVLAEQVAFVFRLLQASKDVEGDLNKIDWQKLSKAIDEAGLRMVINLETVSHSKEKVFHNKAARDKIKAMIGLDLPAAKPRRGKPKQSKAIDNTITCSFTFIIKCCALLGNFPTRSEFLAKIKSVVSQEIFGDHSKHEAKSMGFFKLLSLFAGSMGVETYNTILSELRTLILDEKDPEKEAILSTVFETYIVSQVNVHAKNSFGDSGSLPLHVKFCYFSAQVLDTQISSDTASGATLYFYLR